MKAMCPAVGLLVACLGISAVQAEDAYCIDNVVIVLDASGSMGETLRDAQGSLVVKIEAAKRSLIEVLQSVPPTTHIGLLVFSGKGFGNEWLYPLGPRDDKRLQEAILLPRPSGGTPLGTYIKKGADRLLEQRQKQHGYGTYRLLVVTDGEATDGNLTDIYTPEVIARGITVDVIGVAMEERHTLATKVHSYRSADDPALLTRALRQVFAEVSAKDTTDTAGGDAFQRLEGLPDEAAAGMIKALAETGNHPIGTPSPSRSAAEAAQVPSPIPGKSDAEGYFPGFVTLVFAAVIVLVVLRIVTVRRGKRRRR